MRLLDHYWNYHLVGEHSLVENEGLSALADKIIVCMTPTANIFKKHKTSQDKDVRLYTQLADVVDLYKLMMNLDPEDRTLYEVILGEFSQKIHFDIDVHYDLVDSAEKIREAVMNGIIEVVTEVELIPGKDILLFSSHSDKKKSYHIVVDNYCVRDNKECKLVYDKVIQYCSEYLTPRELDRIDHAVYNSRQNFRLVGCTKKGELRTKTLESTFTLNGIEYETTIECNASSSSARTRVIWYNMFKMSLVSWTHECKRLTQFKITSNPRRIYESEDLSENDVQSAIDALTEKMGEFPFEVTTIVEGIVSLKKLKNYQCLTCDRVHESENPFLAIGEGVIRYVCRRSNCNTIIGDYDEKKREEEAKEIIARPLGVTGVSIRYEPLRQRVNVEPHRSSSRIQRLSITQLQSLPEKQLSKTEKMLLRDKSQMRSRLLDAIRYNTN